MNLGFVKLNKSIIKCSKCPRLVKFRNKISSQKRKQYQNAREEYEMRNQFKGKYSKLAQISRNTLVFVEYFQTEIHKEIIEEKKGKKIHSIEDKQRLITMTQKIQRLSKEANDTLTDIENPLNELLD